MPLRPITVRFEARAYELAHREATARGVSLADYIRVAVLARAMSDWTRRNPEGVRALIEVFDRTEDLAAVMTSDLLDAIERYFAENATGDEAGA